RELFVPTLAIFRDDALEQEFVLDGRDLRIGRSEANDVVLLDASKTVSRIHAQLRYENGRFVLNDLDSENGIWVRNRRQPRIVIQSDVPVTIGPYTLALRDTAPAIDTYIGTPSPDWDGTYNVDRNPAWSEVAPVRWPPRRRPKSAVVALAIFTVLLAIVGVILRRGTYLQKSQEAPATDEVLTAPESDELQHR